MAASTNPKQGYVNLSPQNSPQSGVPLRARQSLASGSMQIAQASIPTNLPPNLETTPDSIVKKTPKGVQFLPASRGHGDYSYPYPPHERLLFENFNGEFSDVAVKSTNGNIRVIPAKTEVTAGDFFQDGDQLYFPQRQQQQNRISSSIQEQVSALSKDLPVFVKGPLELLEREYRKILDNPNVQQAAQQLEQWVERFQKVVERAPKPIRDAVLGALPGTNIAQALWAKQAWDTLPSWVRDTIISFAPFGDGVDLVKEAYNAAIGKGADPVIVTLGTIGLAGDLGWLDGIIPDPVDGVNAGAAVLKAAYKNMGSPAREAMTTLIQRVSKNADELAQFTKRLGDLLPNVQPLMKRPDSLPRLFNLSDAAFKRAMDSPQALQEAIRRAEFADNFIGKKLSDLTPAQRQTLEQAYNIDKNGVIRRKSVDDGYTQLTVKQDGTIREGSGKISDRLSNPTQMKKNFEAAYGAVPKGHQIHHLLPDSVVRDHELTQLAMKAGYNLDESSNLLALPYTQEALQTAKVKIVHLGSHPKWSDYVTERLGELRDDFIDDYGSLAQVPPEILKQNLKGLEKEFRDLLTRGDIPKLRQLGLIDENYIFKDGTRGIRLTQAPNHEKGSPQPPTTIASAALASETRSQNVIKANQQAQARPNFEEFIVPFATAVNTQLTQGQSAPDAIEASLTDLVKQNPDIPDETLEWLATAAFEQLEQHAVAADQIVQG